MPGQKDDAAAGVKMKVYFDIFETNITGCASGLIAWALNVTKE